MRLGQGSFVSEHSDSSSNCLCALCDGARRVSRSRALAILTRSVRPRRVSLEFFIYDIQWPSNVGLPDEATISLSDELVEATDIEEDQWHDAVNDQLQRQFGERAISFQMTGDDD